MRVARDAGAIGGWAARLTAVASVAWAVSQSYSVPTRFTSTAVLALLDWVALGHELLLLSFGFRWHELLRHSDDTLLLWTTRKPGGLWRSPPRRAPHQRTDARLCCRAAGRRRRVEFR